MEDIQDNIKRFQIIAFLLTMISLCFSIYVIKDTYAKYITNTSGNAELQIARWKIIINDQDVEQNNSLTSAITPVFEGTNDIAANVIAPTAEGYFDLLIDASNTDVSFNYEITTSDNENSSVSDIVLSAYSLDDGAKQEIETDDGQLKLTGTVNRTDENKSFKIRVYLEWNDDPDNGATMDNQADTSTTVDVDNKALVNVNVKFIQKVTT